MTRFTLLIQFPWGRRLAWPAVLLVLTLLAGLLATGAAGAEFPSLPVDILGADGRTAGKARIYSNYLEVTDAAGNRRGAIGVVIVQGRQRLFLVAADGARKLVGWAEEHRLFDAQGKLRGFYNWTPIWSYVYDGSMKKVGEAQCLAYQGVCAAGVAGFLLGLF